MLIHVKIIYKLETDIMYLEHSIIIMWRQLFSNLQINLMYVLYTQGVPGVKVTTSGFNSRADSESKISYTHGSNLQWFRSYEFFNSIVNKLRKKVEHCAFIEICC
jgi:hypothetical protein